VAIYATDGTKTDRRKERSAVREILGTSRDGAPGVRAALRAAARLGQILSDASGGRFKIYIWSSADGTYSGAYSRLREIENEEVYD
jgi:hypothetical protein